MLGLNARPEYKLILELYRYPRHMKDLEDGSGIEFGCHWNDINLAAVLLCRTAFWGNTPRQIEGGPVKEYPGAPLRMAMKLINPTTGTGGARFVVDGPPAYLRTLLHYYGLGMLYVIKPEERQHWLSELVGTVQEARLKASESKERIIGIQ